VRDAVGAHRDYVTSEVLAESLEWMEGDGAGVEPVELNGHACRIVIERV
jgi:hypothetical protein